MRRFLPYLGICVAVFGLIYLSNPGDAKKEWAEYIQNHPFSQKAVLSEIKDIPRPDRPDLAMQQNFLMIVDPALKTVPVDRLVTAFGIQKQGRTSIASDAISSITWEEKGPNNVGGRTRALMWDPNDADNKKLWAAGIAGGIWFNNDVTDETSSWQNINDFMANLAVTTLAYDPTNPRVFYAGTGGGYYALSSVRGAGIFKSSDGGVSWSQIVASDNATFNYVQRIIVTSRGTILASTRGGGIQRSPNGGDSWTTVLNSYSSGATTSRSRGNDLELATNGDIYASLGIRSGGSIHRSTDDGETWVPVTPPQTEGRAQRIELAVAPSASNSTATTVIYAVASYTTFVEWFKKSVDGGDSWSDIPIPRYRNQDCIESSYDFTREQAWFNLTLAVSPTDENVVLAGGINVLKSSNGGTTMAEVSSWIGECDAYVHGDIHNILFRPGNPDEAVIASDGGVSYSPDIGSSSDPGFFDRNKDYNVTQFYAVAAQNTADIGYFIAGTQDNGTQQFTDAEGLSTRKISGGDGAFCFIDQDDNNFQISSYPYNRYRLHDATGTFLISLANGVRGRFTNPADYDNETNILYSAGDSDELMRISGISTRPNPQEILNVNFSEGKISALRADANTANRIFAGTGFGYVYRVDNANAIPIVTDITSNISTVGYISSIDIGSSDDELVVTFSNYGVHSVWYTDNGGDIWTNKDNDESLPDIPVRWALFNPKNTREVLLATELGVWSTSDITSSTPEWWQTSDNLANVRCNMLQYRSSDDLVVVATHGRGIFTSNGFSVSSPLARFLIRQNTESITLSWIDNSDNEDNYIVERSIGDKSSYSVIATLDPDTETYTYTDAILADATNKEIYYRVHAVLNGNFWTVNANVLSIPGIPTLAAPANVTSGEFTINWTVRDDATQFILDVSESADFSDFLEGYEKKRVTGLSSTITDRRSGIYYFRVAGSNASGQSDFSTIETIILNPLSVIDSHIVCYPNPGNGEFYVKGVNIESGFEILNILGQKMDFEQTQKDEGIQFDISNLASGSYVLRINDQSGSITKTIIKK